MARLTMPADTPELLTDPFLGHEVAAATAPPKDPLVKEIEEARTGRKAKEKEVEAAEQEIIRRQQEKVSPALEQLTKETQKHGEIAKALTEYKEEAPPSMALRPFLDADTKNSIQAVVAGIGTLITAAIGGRAPIAAMHAFTGAMDGWAAGDMERANRSFADYQARLGKLHRETSIALQRMEWARQLSMDDLERANIWAQTALMDVGQTEKAYELKQNGLARAIQSETIAYGVYDRAWKHHTEKIKLGIEAANAQARIRGAEAAMRRAAAYEKLTPELAHERQARLKLAQSAAGGKIETAISGLDKELTQGQDFKTKLDRLKTDIAYLHQKGVLVEGPTIADWLRSATNKAIAVGDTKMKTALDNVRSWGTSSVIKAELALMGKVASILRIKSIAEAEAGNLHERSYTWWTNFLEDATRVQQVSHDMASERKGHLLKQREDVMGAMTGASVLPTAPEGQTPDQLLEELFAE